MLTVVPLLILLVVCLYTDLRHGRVPNRYTLPAVLVGVALNAWQGGWMGARGSLLAAGIVFIFGITVANLAQVGAGDLKLLMAVGALRGPRFLLFTVIAMGIAGGLLAVAYMIRRKRMPETGVLAWAMAMNISSKGKLAGMLDAGKLPYTIPIAIGCTTALILLGWSG